MFYYQRILTNEHKIFTLSCKENQRCADPEILGPSPSLGDRVRDSASALSETVIMLKIDWAPEPALTNVAINGMCKKTANVSKKL